MAVPGEAAGALDAHALADVLQDLLVPRFVADHEEPEPAILQDLERLAVDVGARVRRPGDAQLAEALRDLTRARRVGGEGVVVEEELLHLGEAALQLRDFVQHVAHAAHPVGVAGGHLRPEAEGAARRTAAPRVERHVGVLAVGAVVLEVVEVALVYLGDEGERVELLGGERRRLLVVHHRAVLAVADALHVREGAAFRDRHHRQVELLAGDEVDDRRATQRLLRHGGDVAAHEADRDAGLGVLDRLRRAHVGAEGGRARVHDDQVEVTRDADRLLERDVVRRGVEDARAG